MRVYACSDVGKVRPINEDSYYLPQQGERFCAVADGMGGHNAGEIASALAISTFSEFMRGAVDADRHVIGSEQNGVRRSIPEGEEHPVTGGHGILARFPVDVAHAQSGFAHDFAAETQFLKIDSVCFIFFKLIEHGD